MSIRICSLVSALAFSTIASAGWAQTPPDAADLRLGLAGQWEGALGYRDYQSNQLFEIPVQTTIEALPDAATTIRRSLFNDGPNNPVWITTVSLEDRTRGATQSASYRAGRPVEVLTETVALESYTAPDRWTLVYRTVAQDGDGPAEIRVTETRTGDDLRSVKDVRPIGGGEGDWAFRNQTRLSRRAN